MKRELVWLQKKTLEESSTAWHGNENGEAFCFSMSLTPPSHPSKARFFQSKIRKILFRTFLVIAAHWLIQRSRGP